jgi:hypothetical protein
MIKLTLRSGDPVYVNPWLVTLVSGSKHREDETVIVFQGIHEICVQEEVGKVSDDISRCLFEMRKAPWRTMVGGG